MDTNEQNLDDFVEAEAAMRVAEALDDIVDDGEVSGETSLKLVEMMGPPPVVQIPKGFYTEGGIRVEVQRQIAARKL